MPRDLLKVKDKDGNDAYFLIGSTIAKSGQDVAFPVTTLAQGDNVWGATTIPTVEHMDDKGNMPVAKLPGVTVSGTGGGRPAGRRKRSPTR